MVGIAPSVALSCHFFSLRLTDPSQCLGCVSFQAVAEMAALGIDFNLPLSMSRFRTRWLYVDVGVLSLLLSPPLFPAVPNPDWGHERLTDPRLAFAWLRLKRLKGLGITAPMVMKEFIRRRVAPLQCHSRPMWALSGSADRTRLQESGLPLEARRTVLAVLTADPSLADMPQEGCLLYRCSNRVEFSKQMPPFDEWGLRPTGLEGPRENPVFVILLLSASTELTPRVDAGGERCWRLEARLLRRQHHSRLPRCHPLGLMTSALR